MSKIAIVGSRGYIARYLIQNLESSYEIVRMGRGQSIDTIYLDLEDMDNFDDTVLNQIDVVIFTAAVSSPDECATNYEKCYNINVTGTKNFISKALSKECKIIFLSSDAVFGNEPGMVYNEKSSTCALTPYGRMKKEIEDTYEQDRNFKALRLSYVVSKKDRFVTYCLKCMETDMCAEIFHPFYRNCITIHEVLKAIRWLLVNWERFDDTFLNLAGRDLVSRVRIADEINRISNMRLKYKIVHPGDNFYKNRPAITQMESCYLYTQNILENLDFTKRFKQELEDIRN